MNNANQVKLSHLATGLIKGQMPLVHFLDSRGYKTSTMKLGELTTISSGEFSCGPQLEEFIESALDHREGPVSIISKDLNVREIVENYGMINHGVVNVDSKKVVYSTVPLKLAQPPKVETSYTTQRPN